MKLKDVNFLYYLFRPPITTLFKIYYRIRIVGKENLQYDKPTLVIANHSNSVVDPVVIASSILTNIYFLPRGDVFNSAFKRWIFWQFRMIPIFRKEEGIENLHKNEETFKRVYGLLNKHEPVIIFSEGICVQEKRMRPFRKGTARMAFEFNADYKINDEMHFLPMALNYHNWNKFGSDVIMNVGKRYSLKDVDFKGEENIAKRQLIFTKYAEERLKELMVILEPKELDGMEITLEDMYGKELLHKEKYARKSDRLQHMRTNLAAKLSAYYASNKEACLSFKEKIDRYSNDLSKAGLRPNVLAKKSSYSTTTLKFIFLLLLSPFALAGMLGNYIPFIIPVRFAQKKIKHREFFASAVLVLSIITYIVWYLLMFFTFGIAFESYLISWLIVSVIIGLGFMAYRWYRVFRRTLGRLKYFELKSTNKELILSFEKRRDEIIEELEIVTSTSVIST